MVWENRVLLGCWIQNLNIWTVLKRHAQTKIPLVTDISAPQDGGVGETRLSIANAFCPFSWKEIMIIEKIILLHCSSWYLWGKLCPFRLLSGFHCGRLMVADSVWHEKRWDVWKMYWLNKCPRLKGGVSYTMRQKKRCRKYQLNSKAFLVTVNNAKLRYLFLALNAQFEIVVAISCNCVLNCAGFFALWRQKMFLGTLC